MKNLTAKKIKEIQKFAIETFKQNMKTENKSKTPEYIANSLFSQYENVIIEEGLATMYYKNGCNLIPQMPKYL